MTLSSALKFILLLLGAILLVKGRYRSSSTTTASPQEASSFRSVFSVNDNDNSPNVRDLELQQQQQQQGESFSSRHVEDRAPLDRDEFWLTDSETAILPFSVDYAPPAKDDPYGELEPMWSCTTGTDSNKNERPKKLVFVNTVRSEAKAIQELLMSYASSCHAGFISVVMCSGLSWASMISGTWANRKLKGTQTVNRCPVQSAMDRKGNVIVANATTPQQMVVQSTLLEKSVDILAGQIPLGCAEKWPASQKEIVEDIPVEKFVHVQYLVSLRCPYSWFVSSVMDKMRLNNKVAFDQNNIIATIKEKVEADLTNGLYHEVYARYLITPSQISWIKKEEAEVGIDKRAELSLVNLKDMNAVIIISEKMEEALEKLSFIIDKTDQQKALFQQARDQIIQKAKETETDGDSPSTEDILAALKEDKQFYPRLQEYLQFEARIYDQAKFLHERQLEWVRKHRSTKIVKL